LLPALSAAIMASGRTEIKNAALASAAQAFGRAAGSPPEENPVKDFEVLIPAPMLPSAMEALSEQFTAHRLFEASDRDALLREVAPRIRACAIGSHFRCDGPFMQGLPRLEIVANFGVGYDSVDAVWAGQHGIVVTNTPDVLTEEVADTALGLLLMTVRELPQSERWLRAGHWTAKGPYPLTRSTMRGKTIGIVGLGRIGKAIAKRCEAFGLEIAYYGRNRQADVPYRYVDSLEGLAHEVDILMVVAPGTAETYRMIDAKVLRALGPDGILVNIGRGTVVDEPALVEALRKGEIFAAGLDVFEHEPKVPAELIAMDNVVLLPHVGSGSRHTRRLMGELVVDNIRSWAEGRGPLTPVAETPWPRR
jgi:lactate dehydrogenase-like 2-hydroxyacid dehydrogenase